MRYYLFVKWNEFNGVTISNAVTRFFFTIYKQSNKESEKNLATEFEMVAMLNSFYFTNKYSMSH